MKTCFKGSLRAFIIGLAITTMSLVPAAQLLGQSGPLPSVVISIAPINEQLNDVEYMANAAGKNIGQMSGLVRMQAQGFLRGVDMTKPLGVLFYFESDNPEPNVVAFLPIKNLDDLLDTISNYAEIEEDGDRVTIVPDNGEEVNLRKAGKYAFISNKKSMLDNLPENPGDMVAELGGKYNVAARIYAQRVPEGLRDQVLEFIQQGAESGLDELEEQDELQAEIQRANFDMQMKQMKEMIHGTDELLIGMSADKDAKSIYFDMNMKGKAGSQIEKQFAAAKNAGKSQFSGFLLPKAAFTANACTGVTEEDAAMYIKTLTQARDAAVEKFENEELEEGQLKLLTNLTNNIVDVIGETLKEGKLDMGAVVFTDQAPTGALTGLWAWTHKGKSKSTKFEMKLIEKENGKVNCTFRAGNKVYKSEDGTFKDGKFKVTIEQNDNGRKYVFRGAPDNNQINGTYRVPSSGDKKLDWVAKKTIPPVSLNGAIAFQVANPKKLEASLKEAVAEAESTIKNGEVQFNLNSGSHRGVVLHEIIVQIPDEDNARKVLGDSMKVIVGIGSKEIYLGFGNDPVATLKKAMDSSASGTIKGTQSMEYNLFLAPIMKFAARIEDQELVQNMADAMAKAGNDRIRMTSDFDNTEMKIRFEIQDGILQLFGVAAESMGGQFQGGGDRSDF